MAEPNAFDSTPTPAPPPLARGRIAWWLLFSLFALVIGAQLAAYFAVGDDPDRRDRTGNVGAEVRLGYMQQWLAEEAGAAGAASEELRDALRRAYDRVSPYQAEDLPAARWGVLLARELGESPDPAAVALLRKSESQADRAFAQITEADRLTPEAAATASAALPDTFAADLARIQAGEISGDQGARDRIMDRQGFLGAFFVLAYILLATLLGLVVLVAAGALASMGKIRPAGYPRPALRPIEADGRAGRMAIYMVLFLFVPALVAVPLQNVLAGPVLMVAVYTVFSAVLLASLAVPVFGMRQRLRALLGETRGGMRLVLIGVAGFLGNLPIAFGLAVVFNVLLAGLPEPTHPVTTEIADAQGWLAVLSLFLVAAVFAPVIEELTFRGLLFPALGRFIGVAGGIALSAFMFAAVHPQGPVLWGALAAVGATAAVVTYYSGSLVPAIVMHAIHNASILLLARTFVG